MEVSKMNPPSREIDLSEIGPLILNKATEIYLDTRTIGKPGDLLFTPVKYEYTPGVQLRIEMEEQFILEINKPKHAVQDRYYIRIYSEGPIYFTSIHDNSKIGKIVGHYRVDMIDFSKRGFLNGWSWSFSHEPIEPKWWHHIVPKTWLR
ncbi:hypothetical protein FYJ43_02165 [Cutibacterium sp. WCA-380-WT-3A]|uniref:Uncharacterized protein n=1 Tax=Cutibacterium porci TaxID=2605781 RepID=A0A7K0J4L9_9ACTN|nr:hypothetical protein [Cutibacterium porci]